MAELPPSKVSCSDQFAVYITRVLGIFDKMFDYYSSDRMRKLRFRQYSRQQSAMADLCNRITTVKGDTRRVVVAFGAATFQSAAPTQMLRDALGRLPNVQLYHVNEYYTSKLCNGCNQELTRMKDQQQQDVWTVKHCKNKDCTRKTHHRDQNAALNIWHFFMHEVQTGERPTAFMRATKSDQAPQSTT
jgi:hypothetical protein